LAFSDTFRLSAHAVILNSVGQVLQLHAAYGEHRWGLPGGALEPGETIHQALVRECREELGVEVCVLYLSGVYHHTAVQSHAFIFRCELPPAAELELSDEHSEYDWFDVEALPAVQGRRVADCIEFDGRVCSAVF
jgi:8-oxo-dGTP pyrophosphatase MutT (NUDIX family)